MDKNELFMELLEGLGSPERMEVVKAAHRLGDLGNSGAVPYLLQTLIDTQDPAVRNAAAVGLRELGDRRAVPFLVALLRDPRTEGNRGTLVYALQTMNPIEELPFLVDLVIDGSWEVSQAAMKAIETAGGKLPASTWNACVKKIREALPRSTGDKAEMLKVLSELFEE